jgi:DNA-binding CsgD family transcriptional regulator
VAAHDGRHEEAHQLATEGLALAAAAGDMVLQVYHRHVLGFVALAEGQAQDADRQLRAAVEAATATGTRHPGRFKLDGDRIEALLGVGDLLGAREILAFLDHVNAVAPTPWTRAIGARGRGLLAAAEGDLDAAATALERALAEHARLPMPFEQGRTLLALGRGHRRRKEKRLAAGRLHDARSIFESLGASAWAAAAQGELARIGLRPRAPRELTETELHVATLAASGLSSREIAKAAFLAPKTVGNVLGRVYEKLGIHSRAELGARMGQGTPEVGTSDRSG